MQKPVGLCFLSVLAVVLIAALLSSCIALTPTPLPKPDQVIVSDGRTFTRLLPGDAAYDAVVAALHGLIAAVDGVAYGYYDNARMDAEVRRQPHVEATFTAPIPVTAEGYTAQAMRLVIVTEAEEALVLAQSQGREQWTLFLSRNRERMDRLVDIVQSRVGVNLRSDH